MATNNKSNIIKTDTSWKGDYLSVDLNKDYSALQKQAEKNKDYNQAANYEALRNAKINYLNSVGKNTGGYETTNKYTKQYTNSSGKAHRNNKGGTIYESNGSFSNMNDAGTYNVGGLTYRKDNGGNYYIKSGNNGSADTWSKIGNGYNEATNEFTYTNQEDAKNAYLNQLYGSGVATPGEKYEDLVNQGRIDGSYLDALMSGNVGEWTRNTYEKAAAENKQKQMAILNSQSGDLTEEARRLGEETVEYINDNSFENANDVDWNSLYDRQQNEYYNRFTPNRRFIY